MSKTYKIGNKAQCLIRSYCTQDIGTEHMEYWGQPYHIIKDCECEISFTNKKEVARSVTINLIDSRSFINEIKINDCLITSKILNLIFPKTEEKIVSETKTFTSDDNGRIFFSGNGYGTIYQVYFYQNGSLERVEGELNTESGVEVDRANAEYLVIYNYKDDSRCYNLDQQSNIYLTLDLDLIGNENNKTAHTKIHVDKCSVSINKNMRFTNTLNTVDLVFTVVENEDGANYISI